LPPRNTSTGRLAWWQTASVTEPRVSRPRSPRPRLPITLSPARISSESRTNLVEGDAREQVLLHLQPGPGDLGLGLFQ
jgi:hypothetical protein